MTVVAIIPARGGSQRIPGKNIKEFEGKPIIAHSIEAAKSSGRFDRIIVSTDDRKIAAVAMKYDAEVWNRDPSYGSDEIGTQAVTAECLKGIGVTGWDDYACCIYATAPLICAEDLNTCFWNVFRFNVFCDYAFTVGYPPLRDAGQFYWGRARAYIDNRPLVGPKTHLYLLPADRVCDINTPEDWDRAVNMYRKLRCLL